MAKGFEKMEEPINFVCLKWGTKYHAEYVNRLYRMVQRNFTLPFRFFCLTEDAQGLETGIEPLPLEVSDLQGWWYKLSLFQKDFFQLEGEMIYLDLDVVIVDNIDFLAKEPGDFLIIKNWSRNQMWNSSVMRFKIGKYAYIWDRFLEQKEKIVHSLHGDQEWIFECVPEASTWPENRILSYKKSLNSKAFPILQKLGLEKLGLRAFDWMDTPLPNEASIIIFHGKPDPDDVAEHAYGFWKRASFIHKAWYK